MSYIQAGLFILAQPNTLKTNTELQKMFIIKFSLYEQVNLTYLSDVKMGRCFNMRHFLFGNNGFLIKA